MHAFTKSIIFHCHRVICLLDEYLSVIHPFALFQTSSRKSSVGGTKKKTSLKLELTAEQKKDIQDAFNLFDPKGTGSIEARDLKVHFYDFSNFSCDIIIFIKDENGFDKCYYL